MTEAAFDKWSFVEKDIDQEHWFVRLTGGKYHGVVYKYESIKLNDTTQSIDFDYEVIDYLGDDPHGEVAFNKATGDILRSILDDAMDKNDYVLGCKKP
jgi:hypothetical protein